MQIIYGNQPNKEQVEKIHQLSCECGITFDTARLLFFRGIDTAQSINKFLHPSLKNLHSPFLFKDMQGVVSRLQMAKDLDQKVAVCGDYDADGVCATAIIYYCLKEYGITPKLFIPEREQGYGLNTDVIFEEKAQNGLDLVITVDCGISDKDKISTLKNGGVDVIVTDHHQPPEELPNCLIINPKQNDCGYPFDGLCGAGVAYKVGYALIGKKANDYIDFVTLATVADSMPLLNENRDLVFEGLKTFNSENIRGCFKQLLGDSDKTVTASTLAYTLAPRVNAGGRMGDANSALKLFISQDENQIYDLAVKLNQYNVERQTECDLVYKQTKSKIIANKLYNNSVICVKGEDWSAGVIGIVAAKLVEDYNRPVIVFALHDGFYKGSARSVAGVNILELISCAKDILIGFGGHAQAAGVSVEPDNFDAFNQMICDKMQKTYGYHVARPTIRAEWLTNQPISTQFAKEIDMLEPFGTANPKPCFVTEILDTEPKPIKQGSPHYNFQTNALAMLYFNAGKDLISLWAKINKKVVFEINYSVFRGREQVKGFVKRIISDYGDFEKFNLYLYKNQLNCLLQESGFIEKCDNFDYAVKDGYGTMYVASNIQTLKQVSLPDNFDVSPLYPDSKSGKNCLVVSPAYVGEEYNQVVYLDAPLQPLKTQAKSYCKCTFDTEFINNIKIDREYFASVFNLLKTLDGKKFLDSVWGYNNYGQQFDYYSFIFAVEVFLELGIFSINNGVICWNSNVKNALTNSLQYSKICSIKEDLC